MKQKQIVKSISQVEPQKLGLVSIACFLLVSLALLATSSYYYPSLPTSSLNKGTADTIQTTDSVSLQKSKAKNKTQEKGILFVTKDVNDSSISVGTPKQLRQYQNNPKQLGKSGEEAWKSNQNLEPKIVCDFSNLRTDVCEIKGDIRINGKSSSVLFLPSSQTNTTQSWTIKPHPRKYDRLIHATNISIRPFNNTLPPQHCTISHSIPAVVFSTGGYMGNAFHDFTDVLIPLFITSRQFNGEVQFLVTEIHPKWNIKYQPILRQLSHYDILDFNSDREIHCYPRTIVGLRCHEEMTIDPSRSPYTMPEFGRLVRTSFNLPREIAYSEPSGLQSNSFTLKPRLLIIARKRTRQFKNVDEIVKMAEGLGFEVVVGEPEPGADLAKFARLVNSCDVMMGVHGAGLTNLVFLPANAVLIQVVPFGRLERHSKRSFGVPAEDLGLKYLQYSIGEEESTLEEIYPRDDAVFKDPDSIHRQGWNSLASVYLVKQNVRLDVKRFKGTLLQALELLKS